MPTNDEILFGRIAVLSKFVTQEQVDECIVEQERLAAASDEMTAHLGTLLVENGYLTEREKRAILQVQKENLQRREAGTNARRQERIFGYLVMKLGYCSEQQVFECVREQAKMMRLNLIFRLGEVFVSKAYLSHSQVEEVLALQDKFIVTCQGCRTKFNVVRYQAGTRVKCPECGFVIQVPDVLGNLKREQEANSGSSDTTVITTVDGEEAEATAKGENRADTGEAASASPATESGSDTGNRAE